MKEQRGGKREGSGRKTDSPTGETRVPFQIRLDRHEKAAAILIGASRIRAWLIKTAHKMRQKAPDETSDS